MKTVCQINEFISKTSKQVNKQFRQKYHMMPTVGWMNDPNGLIYFGGKYHLFYQYNPFDAKPATMLWGHSTSSDLVHFCDEKVAIVPVTEHTSIFSGGAIQVGEKLVAVYTEHYEHNGKKSEQIFASYSSNGIDFEGRTLLFDNEQMPEYISREDFRDPYPVKVGNRYYVMVGGKDTRTNQGIIVVLGGNSLETLQFCFVIGPFEELGDMGECPSWHKVDSKDVILVSGCNVKQKDNDFHNVNSSIFIVGDLDFEQGKFNVDFIKEIDKGDCFYAPQFINCCDRPIMVGWNEMWGKPYPTHDLQHGWVGAFAIPRVLSINNDDIYQQPIDSVAQLRAEQPQDCIEQCSDILLNFTHNGEVKFIGDDGSFSIALDDNGKIVLDTRNSNNLNGAIRTTNQCYTQCFVRVLIDSSSVEVFVSGGKEAISSRVYLQGNYKVQTHGGADIVNKWKVNV